jgi:hypothetical protein
MESQWEVRPEGWYVGKLLGRDAFSDGRAMFLGKPPIGDVRMVDEKAFDYALGEVLPEKMEAEPTKPVSELVQYSEDILTVLLEGGVHIPVKHFHYATKHFPVVKFYLGTGRTQATRGVICKVGNEIVGVIMPMNPDY